MVAVVILLITVLAVVVVPADRRHWVALGGVAIALLSGAVRVHELTSSLAPLRAPLAFLALAVPFAVLLDDIGFFAAIAARVEHRRGLLGWLWVVAALVTTLFNLDAAIVLLTPLYLRIAGRHGLDPLTTALPPVVLSALASSALPVSNLTNLIAATRWGSGAGEFVWQLGPPSLLAVAAAWFPYRAVARRRAPRPDPVPSGLPGLPVSKGSSRSPFEVSPPPDRRAVTVGVPVVAAALAGFTIGDAYGVPAWAVLAVLVSVLVVATRRVPWRVVPVEAAGVAAGLSVLATGAASVLPLDRLLAADGRSGRLLAGATGVVLADAVNNLPALLVGLPSVSTANRWAFLLGVNTGPVLWMTGSLAGLLWADLLRRQGIEVSMRTFARLGLLIGGGPVILGLAVVSLRN